jgi:hypothetical protein
MIFATELLNALYHPLGQEVLPTANKRGLSLRYLALTNHRLLSSAEYY